MYWIGEPCKNILDVKYDKFRCQVFKKTGCLPKANSSGNHLVQPGGMPNYHMHSPTMVEPTSHFWALSVHEGDIKDTDGECQHGIKRDEEENDMYLDEKIESDDGNIFYIFESWFFLLDFFFTFFVLLSSLLIFLMFLYNFVLTLFYCMWIFISSPILNLSPSLFLICFLSFCESEPHVP